MWGLDGLRASHRWRGRNLVTFPSGTLQRLRMSKAMLRKKVKLTPPKTDEVHQVSPQLQARIDRFAKAIGHLILIKIDPEAARRMSEDLG